MLRKNLTVINWAIKSTQYLGFIKIKLFNFWISKLNYLIFYNKLKFNNFNYQINLYSKGISTLNIIRIIKI